MFPGRRGPGLHDGGNGRPRGRHREGPRRGSRGARVLRERGREPARDHPGQPRRVAPRPLHPEEGRFRPQGEGGTRGVPGGRRLGVARRPRRLRARAPDAAREHQQLEEVAVRDRAPEREGVPPAPLGRAVRPQPLRQGRGSVRDHRQPHPAEQRREAPPEEGGVLRHRRRRGAAPRVQHRPDVARAEGGARPAARRKGGMERRGGAAEGLGAFRRRQPRRLHARQAEEPAGRELDRRPGPARRARARHRGHPRRRGPQPLRQVEEVCPRPARASARPRIPSSSSTWSAAPFRARPIAPWRRT